MYDSYPEDLCDHYEHHGKSLPSLTSNQGQALAWLAQPEMRGGRGWIDREAAMKFFDDNNMKSSDPIQPFNKPGGSTPGVKLDNTRGKGFYSLKFPFEFNDEEKRSNVRMNVCMNGTKEEQVNSVKRLSSEKTGDQHERCGDVSHSFKQNAVEGCLRKTGERNPSHEVGDSAHS